MAAHQDHEDLISIGAYRKGANRTVDTAIDMREEIERYLRQRIDEPVTLAEAAVELGKLYERGQTRHTSAGIPSASVPITKSSN